MNRNHVFDSSGPDMRLRGTAQQLYEKYLQLGRDATSSDDRVAAEGYFQHAEHYFRIVNAMAQAAQQHQAPQQNGYNQNPQHAGGQQNAQGGFQGNPRRFADPEEEDADGNQRAPQREFQPREQPPREFQQRDGNRDQNRFRNDAQRNDGPRNDGQRDDRRDFRRDDRQVNDRGSERQGNDRQHEARERDDRQDDREQPVSRIVAHDLTQPAPESASESTMAPRIPSRPVVQDLGETAAANTLPFDAPPAVQAPAPAPVRTRAPRAEPKAAATPVEASTDAGEPAAAPARAPRAPRARRPRVTAEQNGLGDQPEIKPAPSLTTVED